MGPTLGIDVAAPAELAWQELVELGRWPHWGPSVRAARLDDGGALLSAGATGAVQTAVGLWLPFEIEEWHESASRRSWSWRVAGVRATDHRVLTTGPSTCRVEMSVPWWAPAYLGVVGLALPRIGRRAEAAATG
ncbi:SRPBCC family protein [Nocardioides sp. URHA0020]|uniref:SRPBCC family protein n=1 Tax=Nocardioides sp. URHA0020 TaxID=1380392 RepID=UPI00048F7E8A|nr:SRPBCC family protein [Nocardioides sp. URHA0020]